MKAKLIVMENFFDFSKTDLRSVRFIGRDVINLLDKFKRLSNVRTYNFFRNIRFVWRNVIIPSRELNVPATFKFFKRKIYYVADPTGFEPAIFAVTGRHVNPLHHGSIKFNFCHCQERNSHIMAVAVLGTISCFSTRPNFYAEGGIRTHDISLMKRVLLTTELPRQSLGR